MKQPPTIEPAPSPGPGYDPMDRIVQDLQNIESFVLRLEDNPDDLDYLKTHLSPILGLRRTIAQQIDQLEGSPYSYPPARLILLKKENEKIFSYLEGLVGEMQAGNLIEFKKFVNACGKALSDFDDLLTP